MSVLLTMEAVNMFVQTQMEATIVLVILATMEPFSVQVYFYLRILLLFM